MRKRLILPLLVLGGLISSTPVDAAPVIHTRVVRLRHAAVDSTIHTLHWDDINGLPAGVISVTGDTQRHALRIEGTDDGISAAVQAIGFVDIAPRAVRLDVRFAFLHHPATIAKGHKLPSGTAVATAAYGTIAALPASVDNNDAVDLKMTIVRPVAGAQDVDTGVHISPRVNENDTVTLHGMASLDQILSNLNLRAASPDSIGQVELVQTAPSGKPIVLGGFKVRKSTAIDGPVFYLYVLITPRVK